MSRMARTIGGLVLLLAASTGGCITRPGMNGNCEWPPETPRPLVLSSPPDARHLVIDAELVAESVDRYRFSGQSQEACEARLIDAVARTHGVSVADFLQARERIPHKGLDLSVNLPMAALFIIAAWLVVRTVQRRFAGEKVPTVITLVLASVVLSWVFVMLGEFVELNKVEWWRRSHLLPYASELASWIQNFAETGMKAVVDVQSTRSGA